MYTSVNTETRVSVGALPVLLYKNEALYRKLTLAILFLLLSEKGSTLKGKNLLPLGANSFLLEQTLFQKGTGVPESKQEVTKVVFLVKNSRKSVECIHPS